MVGGCEGDGDEDTWEINGELDPSAEHFFFDSYTAIKRALCLYSLIQLQLSYTVYRLYIIQPYTPSLWAWSRLSTLRPAPRQQR